MDFTDETIPMPRIGDQAPVFDAVTTQGKIHFPLDFSGKWIILSVILPISLRYVPPNSSLSEL